MASSILRCAAAAVPLFFLAPLLAAQPSAPVDPAIAGALQQVSAQNIRATIEKLVTFNNRSTLSSMETDLPSGTGVTAAADWIFSEFERTSAACAGCLEVKRDDFIEPAVAGSRITRPTRIQNIYAVLKGTDPAQAARRVLVTGHYDSRNTDVFDTHNPAPGANDDSSGVAVSLECARVLSKLKFPSTIIFVAVAGEEQGLNGSRHLAKLAKAEGWQLEAVLNNDIVGGDTTPGATGADKSAVRVFSEGVPGTTTLDQLHAIQTIGAESDSPARELARAVTEIGRTYFQPTDHRATVTPGRPHSMAIRHDPAFHPVLIFRRDRFLRGGDHTSFSLEGFPAIRFTEWQENFNHQHQNLHTENGIQFGDLIQFDDFDYIANVARINAATLATLASAPGAPQNVGVVTTNLDNDTTLRWQPPVGMPAGTTFQVVTRDSNAPDWTNVIPAGAGTSITLHISKDNTIFGIRSADAAGHHSAAVYPLPIRAAGAAPVPGTSPPPTSAKP
ncbi:MAG: M20/M25/M40 family metallo-hydrolase [Granulicella sp.]